MDSSSSLGPVSYFLRGFIFGAIILLLTEVLLIIILASFFFDISQPAKPPVITDNEEYLLRRELTDSEKANADYSGEDIFQADDEHYHPEEWPENIVQYIRDAMVPNESDTLVPPPKFNTAQSKLGDNVPVPQTPATAYNEPPTWATPTESCHWLNVVLHRFFLELRVSEFFKAKLKKKTADKISMKLQGNAFISSAKLTDILLGDNVPEINGIRLLKALTEDLSVMLEADLSYIGGACIALEVSLTSGLTIPARVYIEQVSGKVRIRLPSVVAPDMLGFGFLEDPGINFRVDTPITFRDNEFVRDIINKGLGKIVRKVFIEQWVLPAWRIFFLPMMEPSPSTSLIRMDKYNSNTQRPIPPHRRHVGLSGREEAIWKLRSQGKPSVFQPGRGLPVPTHNHWDILAGRGFSLSTIVSESVADLDRLENTLVPLFIKLVRESDKDYDSQQQASSTIDGDAVKYDIAQVDVPKEKNSIFSNTDGVQSAGWRSIRNRGGINLQKKRVSVAGHISEVSRGFVRINCEPRK
ncbi:PDZ domain-containing protein 8, partial [Nowakowskiella sp. JEL0078]